MATPGRDSSYLGVVTPSQRGSRRYAYLFDDLRRARETLKLQYYHDYEFGMSLPEAPLSGFCYLHPSVRDVYELHDEAPVPAPVLEAMAIGMLDKVSNDYYLIYPEDAQEMYHHVKSTTLKYETEREEKRSRGVVVKPLEDPLEKNPLLTKEDADLLDLDFEESPLNQRKLPTLQLLKRPIYTELGQIPRESRNQARLARVGGNLGEANDATTQDSSRLSGRTSQFGSSATRTTGSIPQSTDEWVKQVNVAFKRSSALDKQFSAFEGAVLQQKLGLVNSTQPKLVTTLLALIANCATAETRARCWVLACRAAKQQRPEDGFAVLKKWNEEQSGPHRLSKELLQDWEEWYTLFGAAATHLPLQERLSLATHKPTDLFCKGEREFPSEVKTDFLIEFEHKIDGYTFHHPTKSDVVPLSVRPLLPSGAKSDPLNRNVSEDAGSLTHLVFSNTRSQHLHELTASERQGEFTPHLSVDGLRLLRPSVGEIRSASLPCGTGLYETLPEQFMSERVLEDAKCTYLLQVFPQHAEYSRVGRRVVFDHTSMTKEKKEESKQNTVVVWLDDIDVNEALHDSGRKRPRHDEP